MTHRWLVPIFALAACGDNLAGPQASAGPDAAPAIDAPSGFVEAPHPSQPTVTSGGDVLAAPKVVPVFFANDTDAQTQLETFLGQLATSSYWTAITEEYGVGALTIAPTVIATETPPTTDTALQAIITAHAGGTGGWPANDANTIYTVFLPAGVVLTQQGQKSCVAFAGYHNATHANVAYALVPRCTSQTFPGLQEITIATSHELLEAATDPHPQGGFASLDDEDAIWQLAPGAELGDMCEFSQAAFQPLVGTFVVQRTWSNASAAAGHDPCVPRLASPYVEAATNLADITIDAGGQSLTTRGIKIPVGMSKTVEVDLYSDAEAPDWTVEAIDVASKLQGNAPELTFAFDKTTGHNGDKLQLTITRVKASAQFGISELGLLSKVDGKSVGTWWALVTQ